MRNGSGVRTSLFLPCMLVSVSLFLIYILPVLSVFTCRGWLLLRASVYQWRICRIFRLADLLLCSQDISDQSCEKCPVGAPCDRVCSDIWNFISAGKVFAKGRQRDAYQSSGAVYGSDYYSCGVCSQ